MDGGVGQAEEEGWEEVAPCAYCPEMGKVVKIRPEELIRK